MPDSKPTVAAVMLANGRPEMVARAAKSFRAQTYERKRLLVYDTGADAGATGDIRHRLQHTKGEGYAYERSASYSIGTLRNRANTCIRADILIHFDSDDWSHPNRIAEQVALLQSSGAECVGYDEMLFWREPRHATEQEIRAAGLHPSPGVEIRDIGLIIDGEAWLYRSQLRDYAIGTSMCYWRKTWERHPFPDRSEGCDDLYWHTGGRVKIASMSSLSHDSWMIPGWNMSPRMIASIHGGNTCAEIDASVCEWRRVPEWDEYCRREMTL